MHASLQHFSSPVLETSEPWKLHRSMDASSSAIASHGYAFKLVTTKV